MAHLPLRSVLAVLALLPTACEQQPQPSASVTVKLPPARAAAARPAFSFKARGAPPKPAA